METSGHVVLRVRGKGGKDASVKVTPALWREVQAYVTKWGMTGYLFPAMSRNEELNNPDGHISATAVAQLFKKYWRRAGLDAKRPAKDEPKLEKAKTKDTAPTGISVATHLERLAKKSGVKLNKVTPRKPSRRCKGDKHIGPVGLTIGFEANIQSLIKLLHALEKGERLVRVEQAEFRRDLKKPQNIQVTLHVVGYELGAR